MSKLRTLLIGAGAGAAAALFAMSANAVTVITLHPTYPGVVSGSAVYAPDELLEFKFKIDAPYDFTFTAVTDGDNFPFPIPESATGAAGAYTETIGPYPVSGEVDYSLTTAVPEPAAWAMMILGAGGLGALLRRRRAPRAV